MVPIVDSVVLAPAAALRPWHLPELQQALCWWRLFPKKDLPQGKVLSWWEFKPLYVGGDKGALFCILFSCHCRTLGSAEGSVNVTVNDTITGKNRKQEAEAKGEGLDWSHPRTD